MSMLLSIQDLKVAFRMGKGVRAEAVKGKHHRGAGGRIG